ncbi:MAG TPA: M24 family metallopeptidase [Polyangiaceae bacterium]|nr:M24 family metallopeptidase [Polyangiaceae bacterium]
MMRTAYVKGIANAQRVARAAVLSVAEGVKPGDSERQVCARLEQEFAKARVQHWLHTPYAWWGERTRFDWRGTWETNALPTDRVLAEGEAFVLDAAPIVAGSPADFAFSGCALGDPDAGPARAHRALLEQLTRIKHEILAWSVSEVGSAGLCRTVAQEIEASGSDVIHTRYPAQVLGHTLEGFPNWCGSAPRIGTGFQLPLLLTYATGLVLHHLAGAPYPFLNASAPGRPQGLYAVEPHLGKGTLGAKFESVLLVDGSETRWLDPELFGEVTG